MQNKPVSAVLQPSFFLPPVQVYAHSITSNLLTIEVCDHYQKRTCRNRYWINSSQGPLCLSIPLRKGKNQQCPMRDVQIAYDENWNVRHLQSVRSAYGKSAYFEHYFPAFERLLSKRNDFLIDLNKAALEWSLKAIGLRIDLQETTSYLAEYPENVRDLRELAVQNPTTSTVHAAQPTIPYAQPWEEKFGFIDGLSILDVLFCCGPESLTILHNRHRK